MGCPSRFCDVPGPVCCYRVDSRMQAIVVHVKLSPIVEIIAVIVTICFALMVSGSRVFFNTIVYCTTLTLPTMFVVAA